MRWKTEYITARREYKNKNGKKAQKLSEGELVLLEETLPRGMWKMGRISKLLPGKDGLTRAVALRTVNGTITIRPFARLIRLEM